MDRRWGDKTAVVTGASTGIARAIAKVLAAGGVRCVIVARRQSLLDELADEIAANRSPKPRCIAADAMHDGARKKLADEALRGTSVDRGLRRYAL